jgi:hypothetical protein
MPQIPYIRNMTKTEEIEKLIRKNIQALAESTSHIEKQMIQDTIANLKAMKKFEELFE